MSDRSTWTKAWALLDSRERRDAGIVLVIMLAAAISAALMVGSIMPFLAVLADPARIESTSALAWAYDYFGFTSVYDFLLGLGGAAFAVIVLSSLLQVIKTWALARFARLCAHSISARLLGSYLAQPYTFFLDQHTGNMGPRILAESPNVVTRFIKPFGELSASGLTTFAIVALLLWVDPIVALSVFAILGGIYLLVYMFSRKRLKRFGQVRVETTRQRFRVTNEALTGIKDIKLVGRENSYLARFTAISLRLARNEIKMDIVSQVPRYVLQVVSLGGVILLCFIIVDRDQIGTEGGVGALLPVLGVFAFAGQRMLPELSKIYHSLAEIQAGTASVDIVYNDFVTEGRRARLPDARPDALGLKERLELDAISFKYPKAEGTGLCDISLSIRVGEKIGIVGTTGAGKTTLADIILGLLPPDQGRLMVDGAPIGPDNRLAWMRSVGYVPQDIFLTDAPVAENIALGMRSDEIDPERLHRAARIARIDTFITAELPDGYQTHVGERGVRLSGGQRQRLGIARALYHDADLVVFDEATSALDNLTEKEVMEAIDALPGDKTVMMIAHRLSTVRRCDKIIVLDRGMLVGFGPWETLIAGNPAFQRIARLGDTPVAEYARAPLV